MVDIFGLARGCNHVSNNTVDYSEHYCELRINSVVPDCDQCAEETPNWILNFMYTVVQCPNYICDASVKVLVNTTFEKDHSEKP